MRHKLEAGDWEALSAIDQYSMVRIRNLRTGSRFTICIIDYRQSKEDLMSEEQPKKR